MNSAEGWRSLFEHWPSSMPKQGLIVTNFQETIPFIAFLVSGSMVLVEREIPDSLGSRKVAISYAAILALKFTSPIELNRFQALGFQAP